MAIAAALALGACASGRSPLPPAPAMPAGWAEEGVHGSVPMAHEWWRAFGSVELAGLIDAALRESPDLAIAAERVLQAEAQVRIAGASLFPVLSFGAGTARRESRPSGGDWRRSDSSDAGLSASYELDLWGGIAARSRAAGWSLDATRFDRETVRLTLVAGIANGYFQLLSLRGRLAVARDNLAIAARVQKVVEARARYGAVSALDVARQDAAVLSLRASIAPLELQERQVRYALAILAGRVPGGFDAEAGSTLAEIQVPRVYPGLPADLLFRRPDLAAAEARLSAANMNITVARAALLPGLSLTGSAGVASNVLVNFLNAPTAAIAIGASLFQPLFDGGRLRAQVDAAESSERELVEAYRRSILAALAEVEVALAGGGRTAEQEALQAMVVEQARIALRLAEVRYREGADDLLGMLDAQRTLFQAEDQLAQVRLSRLQASISLYKALGGGWMPPRLPPAAP